MFDILFVINVMAFCLLGPELCGLYFPNLQRGNIGQLVCEPPRDKTNKMTCAPSEDSDQPGHPTILIRVFTVRMTTHWVLSYPLSAQWKLWLDWRMPRLIRVFAGRTCHFVSLAHVIFKSPFPVTVNLIWQSSNFGNYLVPYRCK